MATQGHARDVVVLSGKRTGFGTFGGSLKDFTATDLGVITVAEGVEDKETLDLLRQIGIDWGQGYLFGVPELERFAPAELEINLP